VKTACSPAINNPDFTLQDEGSIVILYPQTEPAKVWVDENLPPAALKWGNGVVIDRNYAPDILFGIRGVGLVVRG
jgi:hypothetical protein